MLEAAIVDNGLEFVDENSDAWAYWGKIDMDFIRRGKPIEKGYMESFYGRWERDVSTKSYFGP